MAGLLCDVHIWSLREDRDILVRDTDFSAFKYYEKSQQKGSVQQKRRNVKFVGRDLVTNTDDFSKEKD